MDYTKGLDECVGRLQRRLEVGISAFHLLGTETEVGGGGRGVLRSPLGGRRGKGTQQSVMQGGSAPRSNPLHFYVAF